jgi:uracil-DNA glycosylase
MISCEICKEYGFVFDRKYQPVDFIEGKKTSKVWIVGLNPKASQTWIDKRDAAELESYFQMSETHHYFKDFKKVSTKLYSLFGSEYGVCHTDIVKCSSSSFPPKGLGTSGMTSVINNCKGYFIEQLRLWKPSLVICNGSPTCKLIQEIIKPSKEMDTSYVGEFEGNHIYVVLSGFIGRIDDYAKKRLGKEIEHYLQLI